LGELVEKIIAFENQGGIPCIERIDKNWIAHIISEIEEIRIVEQKFEAFGTQGADIFEFVRIFLNILPHSEDETIYIAIALIDLFRNIIDTYALDKHVRSTDVLNYIIEVCPPQSFHILKKSFRTF